MKSIMTVAILSFMSVCTGLSFPQAPTKSPGTLSKVGTPAPAPAAKGQAKPEADEEIPPAEPNAMFPAVVARVNGKPILGKDLERIVRGELVPLGNPEWKNLREDYRGQLVLDSITVLINQKLIYQKATASGIKTTDAEVQAEMQRIAKTFKNDAEMNIALANQMTDRASLEKDLYQSMAITKYVEENVNKKVSVTPDEVAKYYSGHLSEFQHPDMVRTSHILMPAGETAALDSLAKQRAESILARAKKGEDFAKLAKEYSTDASASQGGDMGFSSKDSIAVAEYAEAAFSLPVGSMTLVKTQLGYHIVKVTDKKKEGLSTLEEIKTQLTEFLKNEKAQAELTKLVSQLRGQAKIEMLIPAGQPLKP